MRVMLILGGARSGKSTFAERLAMQSGRRVAYIATATAGDDDMRDRIARHRAARPDHWRTIEEPLYLARAIQEAAAVADVLILDCLTLWLSNWLLERGDHSSSTCEDSGGSADYQAEVLHELDTLFQSVACQDTDKVLLLVSNEVGLGVVPPYVLGRIYRDVLGIANQRVAGYAERVYLMIAGLGVDIKRLHEEAVL